MEKIDIHHVDENYKKALLKLQEDCSKNNYKLICEFLEAAAIGKTARKNASRKQVGIKGRLKNLYLLKICSHYFKKDLNKLTPKDMEKFVSDINENKIKKQDGSKYSEETKSNIKKTLIIFLRYYIKDISKFSALTDWIDTGFKKKEIPALFEEDIKKILLGCNTIQQKAFFSFLFDAGCRIEEALNVRISDITEVKGEFPYYRVNIRNEFSKTQGRHISLFWKLTTEYLKQYLEVHPTKHQLDSPLFPYTYDGTRKMFHKIGKRTLGKSINPHLLRHSSATFYAGQGYEYFQLCKRYGWSIGSNMPNNYIDRSGINEKHATEKFINTNTKEFNEKLEKLEKQRSIEKEMYENRMKSFESEMESLREIVKQLKQQKKQS